MHAPAAPGAAAVWRLRGARGSAWALLLSGWLALGELGTALWPQAAGGVLPLALWLLAIGAGLGLARRRPPGASGLRAGLLGAAGLALTALVALPPGRTGLMLLALAWAVLLVLASLTVRALRRGVFGTAATAGTPILPACAGAALAWAAQAAGASSWLASPELAALWRHGALVAAPAQATTAALLALCALLLAAFVPARVTPTGACRAGLFDCSLPLVGHAPAAWQWPAARRWPGLAAGLVMLPMMASLPAMAPWCAGTGGGGALSGLAGGAVDLLTGPALTGLHLAAMLLPGVVLAAWCSGRPGRVPGEGRLTAAIGLLMLAGVCLWVVRPATSGQMLLSLCHGAAWSLAWAAPMLKREPAATLRRPGDASLLRHLQPGVSLMLAPALMLCLGSAIAQWGAGALVAVHVGLTLWALGGLGLSTALGMLRGQPSQAPPVASAKAAMSLTGS
jgi:hypothetical protein